MNTDTFSLWAPRVLSILRIVAALIFLLLELVGGPLLLLGLFTRPVAFLLAGEMAVAYWMAHAPRNLFPVLNGGDAAILYCFVFLYLVFAGPGPWSLDALMGRERGDASARRGLFASLRR